jgi:hypothetical protein
MARGRDVKPGFFISDELAEVSRDARLLFIGLWTLADREGRLEFRAARLKAQLFPYDSDVDQDKIGEMVDELATCTGRFLTVYIVGQSTYVQIKNFKKHQHIHPNEKDSEIPSPGDDGSLSLVAPTRTYFIQAGEGGNIKIGRTTNLRSRISNLQIGIPARLKLIHVVDRDIERMCHEKFHHIKVDGEWFTPDAELLDFIHNLEFPVITGQATERSGNYALPSEPSSRLPFVPSVALPARDPSAATEEREETGTASTTAFDWINVFKAKYIEVRCRHYGGGEADAKACARMGEYLDDIPETQQRADWEARERILTEFLTSRDKATVSAGWPFSFFVSSFRGLATPPEERPAIDVNGRRAPPVFVPLTVEDLDQVQEEKRRGTQRR